MNEKTTLRDKMLSLRIAFSKKEDYDQRICEELIEICTRSNYYFIHSYLPFRDEIDIKPFLGWAMQHDRTIICPQTLSNRRMKHLILDDLDKLEEGKWGTKHPSSQKVYNGEYDLIVVPGLAFDFEGYRLGYGGGYYDSFLTSHPNAYKIAPAYPFQCIEKVPTEPHDIKVDNILAFKN